MRRTAVHGAVGNVAPLTLLLLLTNPVTARPLSFRIDEGPVLNSFLREGPVAAHLVVRAGSEPRIVIAFPAGDSGVGLWFAPTSAQTHWTLTKPPRALAARDAQGRALHGIECELAADVADLNIKRVVLSSLRVIREVDANRKVPEGLSVDPVRLGNRMVWARNRLDGAAGYRLSVTRSSVHRGVRLKIEALTGDPPLTALEEPELLNDGAGKDQRTRDVLTFLSYREKFLAGSWRYDTYFGRDTLMSLALLQPVLQRAALESGLRSVLDRLSAEGEVAHEEEIGEFAVLQGGSDRPRYDYSMIDESFMLAPVAARALLDDAPAGGTLSAQAHPSSQAYPSAQAHPSSQAYPSAQALLSSRGESGSPYGELLVRNLLWVVQRSAKFAVEAVSPNLVGTKDNRPSGEWRDSDTGLGGGRFPYDVNVALIPAALAAIDRLLQSGTLDPYLSADSRRALSRAGSQLRVWSVESAPLFRVVIASDKAHTAVTHYCATIHVDCRAALASLGNTAVSFDALALKATGGPVAVMHSDGGFALLFGDPTPEALRRIVDTALRPFPAGLMTPIGLLVADAAFADESLQAEFTNRAYHGAVVWSWQQALLAAGLDKQLARSDLPEDLRKRMLELRRTLWSAIDRTRGIRSSELWSWKYSAGHYSVQPFGLAANAQGASSADESNAAQLWSTVYLALPDDSRAAAARK